MSCLTPARVRQWVVTGLLGIFFVVYGWIMWRYFVKPVYCMGHPEGGGDPCSVKRWVIPDDPSCSSEPPITLPVWAGRTSLLMGWIATMLVVINASDTALKALMETRHESAAAAWDAVLQALIEARHDALPSAAAAAIADVFARRRTGGGLLPSTFPPTPTKVPLLKPMKAVPPAPKAATLAATLPPAAAAAASSSEVEVWVLAGQSNCVGFNKADGQDMPAAAAPWPGNILCYNRAGCCWKDAVPNVHLGVCGFADANSCGPDMAFARTLIHTGAAHKVGLVPTACGGTNLFEQWAPGGQLWSSMVCDTRAALRLLGNKGRLGGIIWIQGESDALMAETAAAYGRRFEAWVTATRHALLPPCCCTGAPTGSAAGGKDATADLLGVGDSTSCGSGAPSAAASGSASCCCSPELPVVMAVMASRQRQAEFPFIEVVAEQQRALRVPGLLKVEMAGFEFYAEGGDGGSLVHLSKAGCCALGAAMGWEVAAARRRGAGGGSAAVGRGDSACVLE